MDVGNKPTEKKKNKQFLWWCAGVKQPADSRRSRFNASLLGCVVVAVTLVAGASAFFVMQIVYHSLAAEMVLAVVVAAIAFATCRFSTLSLKSDGKISISRQELRGNFFQLWMDLLFATCVTVPLLLKGFQTDVLASAAPHDLGAQITALWHLVPSHGWSFLVVWLVVVALFVSHVFIKMMSDQEQ